MEATINTPASLEAELTGKVVTGKDVDGKDIVQDIKKTIHIDPQDKSFINKLKSNIPFTKEDTSVKDAFISKYNANLSEGEKTLTLDDLKGLKKSDIKVNKANSSGYQIKNKINLDNNYWMQRYGQK